MQFFEPVILFFLLGALAGFVRSELRIPGVLYESLSIFLLLAIGLKGGVELARHPLAAVALPALVVVAAGALIPLVAYPLLRRIGRLSRADAGSIAGHYGSVSVVTFAVGTTYLARLGQPAEGYMTVLLALAAGPELKARGAWATVPESWHAPLRQRMVLVKGAGDTARRFYDFMLGPQAQALLKQHGYASP